MFSNFLLRQRSFSMTGQFSLAERILNCQCSDGTLESFQLSPQDPLFAQFVHYGNYALKTQKQIHFPITRWLGEDTAANVGLRTLHLDPLTDKTLAVRCDAETIVTCTSLIPPVSQTLLNAIEDVVLITETSSLDSPGPQVIFVNSAFERMTGYQSHEILGKTPRILQGPKTTAESRKAIRTTLAEWKPCRIEVVNYRKTGEPFAVELNISPVADETGWWTHWISVQRDINEQMHTARLMALGELAASIGHEINNPLTIANGYVERIRSHLKKAGIAIPKIEEYIEKYLQASQRVASIVKGMRNLARKETPDLQKIDAREAFEQCLSLVTETYAQQGVTIHRRLAESEAWIQGDSSRLQQCLLNLLSNSRDAVATEPLKQIEAVLELTDEKVLLRVRDSGPGISEANRQKIFQPFFTTKPYGKGTGIGLSTVFSMIQQMQGKIEFENLQTGVEFRISFSRLKSDAVAMPQPAHQEPSLTQKPRFDGLTCLLVDDESELVETFAEYLTELGFQVTGETNSPSALKRLTQESYDLLLTDLRMPNLNGLELIEKAQLLSKSKPKHCYLVTGDVKFEDENLHQLIETGKITGILGKPYQFQVIEESLQDSFFPESHKKRTRLG